jgi:hypothetical protein
MPKHRGKLGNPLCYKCNGFTANIGGSGREKLTKRYLYRYKCLNENCGENEDNETLVPTMFSMVPPSELYPFETPTIYPYKRRKPYKCPICHLPKQGHVCKGVPDTSNEGQSSLPLPTQSLPAPLSLPVCKPVPLHFTKNDQDYDASSLMKTEDLNAEMQMFDFPMPTAESKNCEAKCISCLKPGTFIAGAVDTLLQCNSCDDVAIHYSCLKEFALSWTCPLC